MTCTGEIVQTGAGLFLRPRDMAAVLELGEALAVSIPRSEAHVIRHFLDRMRYGLFVPEVPSE